MRKSSCAIFMIFIIIIVDCLSSFGDDDKEKYGFYVPRNNEEIYGTWVNTTYPGSNYYQQKWVINFWGDWEMYEEVTDEFCLNGTYILVDRLTDAEGNIWYKNFFRQRMRPYPWFELDKIGKSGTVWEFVFDFKDFPTADNMNSTNPTYRIYYRESTQY